MLFNRYIQHQHFVKMSRNMEIVMSDISLCKALKALRVFNRYSQQQLADQLGVSKSFISDLETGRKTVSLKLIGRYSEAFEVSASEIVALGEAYSRREFRASASDHILRLIDWITSDGTGVSKSKGISLDANDAVDDAPLGKKGNIKTAYVGLTKSGGFSSTSGGAKV